MISKVSKQIKKKITVSLTYGSKVLFANRSWDLYGSYGPTHDLCVSTFSFCLRDGVFSNINRLFVSDHLFMSFTYNDS